MALTVDQHAEISQKVMLPTRETKIAVVATCSISQLYFVQFWYKTERREMPMLYKNDTIDNASIGSFIRSARKMKGFTQEELAQVLRIDSKYLSQVERGISLPSYPLMVAFSDTLEVSMEFLTRGVEGSSKSVDKETLFCIPEAKGLTEDEYQFIEKSMKDLIKNLKKRKS